MENPGLSGIIDLIDQIEDPTKRALAMEWLAQGVEQTQKIRALSPTSDLRSWEEVRRPEQLPPKGRDWLVWLLKTGRGWGKTRTGAETIVQWVKKGASKRPALIGPTWRDVRLLMIEGDSGLLASSYREGLSVEWNQGKGEIVWGNGARGVCYSAEKAGRLRGPQHDAAWCDEIREWRIGNPEPGGLGNETWDNLMLGLRIGKQPRVIATTTPLPLSWIQKLSNMPNVRVTRGTTYDNLSNLADAFRDQVVRQYEGSRIGRQELLGEDIDYAEGALWRREWIENNRLWELPKKVINTRNGTEKTDDVVRAVVAIDPAVTSNPDSDETGIIGAVKLGTGKFAITHDWSGRYEPREWARKAIQLYDEMEADRIIGEVNHGGDMIEEIIRVIRGGVPFKAIRASRGKHVRAEPISAAYEQGRIIHFGSFPILEDQLCNFTVDGYVGVGSPDRADAAIYALSELMQTGGRLLIATAARN